MPQRLAPFVLAALAAVACHPSPLARVADDASAQASLEFGAVKVGERKTLALAITNNTQAAIGLEGAQTAQPFSVTGAPDSLPSAADSLLQVSFSPTAAQAYDTTLTLSLSSLKNPTLTVHLTGTGASSTSTTPGASFSLAPAALTFSSRVTTTPPVQGFRITNTGTAALHWTLGASQATGLSLDPPSGTLPVSGVALVTVSVLQAEANPTSWTRSISVDTQETASQPVAVTVNFVGSNPPPPPPQYGASVWPKFHQGNTCTGLSNVKTHTKGTLRFKTKFGPPRMTFEKGTYIGSPVLADDGTIYMLGGDGYTGSLTAYDPLSGATRWTTPITSPAALGGLSIEATPTVVEGGSIFVMTGSENSSVTHFFKVSRDGKILWSDPGGYTDGFDSSPALGADGTLYLAYDDAPAILYFSQGSGTSTPKELGRISLGTRSASDIETQSAAIDEDGTGYWSDNGKLWVVTRAGVLWSDDATGGKQSSLQLHSRSAPVLTPDHVVVYAYADVGSTGVTTHLSALKAGPTQGLEVWRTKLGPTKAVVTIGPTTDSGFAGSKFVDRFGLSSPAVGLDGTIYVGHADGLYALDPATGATKWHAGAAAVASSPAVGADGTVFFGGMDGKFVAVSPTGTVLWTVATGGQINSSPAIGAQGAVYAASDDGFLYAVE